MRFFKFENSYDIGTFSKLTNTYCLVSFGDAKKFHKMCENQIRDLIPVIYTSIADTRVIGRLTVGNSKGLLVPSNTTELELQRLREQLPDTVRLQCLDDPHSALGNVIACNDYAALIHPQMDRETEEIVGDVLGVEVFRQTVADEPLVGAHVVMNNQGALVHPDTSYHDQTEIAEQLQIPVVASSVNSGSVYLSAGIIANDWFVMLGRNTNYYEHSVIVNGLKLNALQDEIPAINRTRKAILKEIL